MAFAAAEVADGVETMLAARGLGATVTRDGERREFDLGSVRITVGPLPDERRTLALFHPRCLLVLTGEGPLAGALKDAIRVAFLRVTG
jgi:hypothetical protein